VQPVPPAQLQLAQRLRQLRQQRWPEARLTQRKLAEVLSGAETVKPATVASWESRTAPKLPPEGRLLAYARFFATRRSIETEPPQLLPAEGLTGEEKAAYEQLEAELLVLRKAARKPSLVEHVSRSWHFPDEGPATLVCGQLPPDETGPLANPANPNYTELLSYADLDALMELHGHVRAENPTMNVYFKTATNVTPDELSGHIILLGGIAWNQITARMFEMAELPVRQVEDPSLESGEIFVAEIDGETRRFLPKWRDGDRTDFEEDVGLLARVPNPFNSGRTLTICTGIHSRGVLGAVRSLTDARLRDRNEHYILSNFGSSKEFVILMSIRVIDGRTMTPDFNSPGGVIRQWPRGVQ
jgi:hypothetical protein